MAVLHPSRHLRALHAARMALRRDRRRQRRQAGGLGALLCCPALRSLARTLMLGACGGMLLGLCLSGFAQGTTAPLPGPARPPAARAAAAIQDPTRPPPGMAAISRSAAVPNLLPALQPAGTLAVAVAARPTPPEKPRLQALFLPQGGEATAMVDGRIVKVGDKVGVLTVAEINAEDIVLRGGRSAERWSLIATTPRRSVADVKEEDRADPGVPATHVAGGKEP